MPRRKKPKPFKKRRNRYRPPPKTMTWEQEEECRALYNLRFADNPTKEWTYYRLSQRFGVSTRQIDYAIRGKYD